jgi:predicted CoA-binding protein
MRDLSFFPHTMPSIAIIGASNNPSKYGNRAVRTYQGLGWTVYPIHPTETKIEGLTVYAHVADLPGPVDRASLYLPPTLGIAVLDEIAAKGATEVWVNPGAGSPELLAKALALGLNVIEACSIVNA